MIIDDPYKALGVRKAINTAGILTRIGDSHAPLEVFRAMEDASKSFVTIAELQTIAGKGITDATEAKAWLPMARETTSILLAATANPGREKKLLKGSGNQEQAEYFSALLHVTCNRLIEQVQVNGVNFPRVLDPVPHLSGIIEPNNEHRTHQHPRYINYVIS